MKAYAFVGTSPISQKIQSCGKAKMFFLFLFIFFITLDSNGQNDTSSTPKHSPRKAAIMSACLPGLGQIYNKKYWKLPIIYTGAAAVTYLAIFNSHYYNMYKEAYIFSTDNDSSTVSPYDYTSEDLLTIKNYYRRNLELTYIVAFGIYALNIVDAMVDAYLFEFSVDDNLTMKISPSVFCYGGKLNTGLTFAFNIGHFKTRTAN
jgi:hypothetical protein